MSESTPPEGASRDADRVALSFDAPGEREEWVADALAERSYVGYLRRVHEGPVETGDRWTEFVSCGCGSTADVTLTVEAVEGGDSVGPETAFAFHPEGDPPGSG